MSYRSQIKFPTTFQRVKSVQPEPKFSIGDYWYFGVFGKYSGAAEMEQHIFKWAPGHDAEHVTLPDETNARGSIGVHANGGAMFSWEGNDPYPELWVQGPIPDFVPAPLDARVDGLVERIEMLEQQVAELELAIANQRAELSDEDRAALNWVQSVRALR